MNKLLIFWTVLVFFLYIGCEEDIDSSPPEVYITDPIESSVVSEITTIKCIATDNDSIKSVELWVDSIATGIVDDSSPYEFFWNTVPYEDSTEHSILVVAEDMNENIAPSNSVSVIVDNSNSNPKKLDIRSITYTTSMMTITIERSTDEDFDNYKILRSQDIDISKDVIKEITSIDDTVIQINDFNPVQPFWYWVQVEDIHGYTSIGEGYFVLDEPPMIPTIREVEFVDSLFHISWTPSIDNDFGSYLLFESSYPDMSGSYKIFETENIGTNIFNHYNILGNQYRYYQLIVKDQWDLQAVSNIETGCSWFVFHELYSEAGYDYGRFVLETIDGGYIVVGNTSFFGDDYNDVLIVKINHKGEKEWRKTYTFSATDKLNSAVELLDGSLIMVGSTISSENTSKDVLLLRLDDSGNIEWYRKYGSPQDEIGHSVDIMVDGSIIIAGEKIEENSIYSLGYLLRVNTSGDTFWSYAFGGSQNDRFYSVAAVNDGGCVMAGMTSSQGDPNGDVWLVRANSDGDIEWEKTFGGTNTESSRSVAKTNDGGYIIVGQTDSYGNGYNDAYLIKTDSEGNEQWYQTFGGNGTDHGRSVVQTSDQGYIISGYTDSFGGFGGFNFWLIKTDSDGHLDWHRSYGYAGDDKGFCGLQALDGGYIIAGYSNSTTNNSRDILIVKTDDLGNTDQ